MPHKVWTIQGALLAFLISRPSSYSRAQGWLASSGAAVQGAVALAAMITGCDVLKLQQEAHRRFRYVPSSKVSWQVMVNDAAKLDGNSQVDRQGTIMLYI